MKYVKLIFRLNCNKCKEIEHEKESKQYICHAFSKPNMNKCHHFLDKLRSNDKISYETGAFKSNIMSKYFNFIDVAMCI